MYFALYLSKGFELTWRATQRAQAPKSSTWTQSAPRTRRRGNCGEECFRGIFNEELVTSNNSAPTLKLTMKTMTWETEVCKQNRSLFSSSRAWVFYQWKYKLRFKERHHQHQSQTHHQYQVHLVEPDPSSSSGAPGRARPIINIRCTW